MAGWTIRQLWNSTAKVKQWRKFNYSNSKSRRVVKVVPYVGTKMCLFQFEHYGITQNAQHAINLMFTGLEVTQEKRPTDFFLVVPFKGREYYVEKPDLGLHPCMIRCSCADFYFTFSYWNWRQGTAFGPKPRRYVRKTRTYPPRNPGHHPGFCKHVYNSLLLMQTMGWTNLKHKKWYDYYPHWDEQDTEVVEPDEQ